MNPSWLRMTLLFMGLICLAAALTISVVDKGSWGRRWWSRRGAVAPAPSPAGAHRDDAAARAEFSLPGEGLDASRILGHTRGEIRAQFGIPEITTDDTDVFHQEVVVQVHYQGQRANALVLGAPHVARHERYVRRWLHLPGDGPLTMAGVPLQLSLFVGDDDRIGVELIPPAPPPEPPSTDVPLPTRATRMTAVTVLKAFPAIPEQVRSRCHLRGRAGARGLDCKGLDSGISYEVDEEENPLTITLLDPAGARDIDQCRDVLLAAFPSLAPERQSREPPTQRERFVSDAVEALMEFTPAGGLRPKPSCSVAACVKGGGRRSCVLR